MFEHTWTITVFLFFFYISYGNRDQKFLKLRNLKDLHSSQYDKLFSAHYADKDKKHASHDIHLQDENGKYIQLSYEAKHSSNTNVLKLDDTLHQNKIASLSCSTDDADREIVRLNFKSTSIAKRYHHDISSSLLDSQQKHFISANHKWKCMDTKRNRIEPILRETIAVEISEMDQVQLILYTKPAQLLDVFEELSISYKTNINHDETNHILGTHSLAIDMRPTNRRRLVGWWRQRWEDIKGGFWRAVNFINNVVDDIITEEAADVMAIAVGFPVVINRNISHSWSWNYDNKSKHALEELELTENLTCLDCYSDVDVVWSLEAEIKNHELDYFKVFVEGTIDITSDININGAHDDGNEFVQQTPKVALPDVSFKVADIQFDFNVYGEMAIGVSSDVKKFAGGFKAAGDIKKGLEYNKSTHETYNYINMHKLNYAINGPQSVLDSGDVMHYARPTLYIEMEHLGDFYFGLQPTFDLKLSKNKDSNCVIHYAPSLKLNTFIGGNLKPIDWHKKMDFAAVQSNLDALAGCVDRKEVVKNQIPDVNALSLQNEYWQWTFNNDSIDEQRRILSVDDDGSTHDSDTSTYLDYPNIDLSPKFSSNGRWNDRSLDWWGNLSEISDICEGWQQECSSYDIQSIKPHTGTLEVSLVSNSSSSLIGIYRTVIEIVPSEHWGFDDALMMSNISCLARHRFDLVSDVFGSSGLRRYRVQLLEYYCDANLSDLGINETHLEAWRCMISLPEEMEAISLDASLGSIVLFDSGNDWCHVFTLATKPKFEIDWQQVDYPSKLWYGIWDCEHISKLKAEVELHFMEYNYSTGEIQSIMRMHNNVSIEFYGYIDLEKMTIKLESSEAQENDFWNGTLGFIGVLDVFCDGTITYAGSIEYDGCGGFLFQGYLDLTPDDDDDDDDDVWSALDNDNEERLINNVVIVTFIIGMATSASIMIACGAFYMSKHKQKCTQNYASMGYNEL